eukprot:CAMPEP_0181403088 /NCGR_PEP_ID=MMETSP1110-20121109/3518_1 /TAXON_ID=174948 /ORGANISM="Symbiodinium sp., Strain CCMP421" /LENGTH=51 /DNA_ID=CAMNT_0023525343 /DNA_START=1 /DNA_END=156 /DNA_ORIENTATION=-
MPAMTGPAAQPSIKAVHRSRCSCVAPPGGSDRISALSRLPAFSMFACSFAT